jgi:hypothetical protein
VRRRNRADPDARYDQDDGLLDDEDAEESSYEQGDSEEWAEGTAEVDSVTAFVAAVAPDFEMPEPADFPKPWQGLNSAPEHIKQFLMEAEMKEINGILDAAAAIEVKMKELPVGTKIYTTLTIRDIKKNGPKKGKPKVRVCVNRGPPGVESHSPTMQMATLRALLALLAAKKAKGAAGDFPQAYLNSSQEIYHVYPPKTARQYDDEGDRIVWALPKALYGGKASGRYWYKKLRDTLTSESYG